ncbi:MAG: glycosyltransferase [Bacteroidales bacterium]|nr:glycosyltransferase [Bacteroidales bacterium]MCF8406062.1 glycosyltransferase [Bacteroidales bacterium]
MSDFNSEKRIVSVSIVAANYNNGRYLDEFIQSIINSTVLPEELIVVDDGSHDNSVEILRRYKNLDWIKIILFSINKGFTSALNTGIEKAGCKYIMRADPDDVLLPNRIETQFDYMENNTSVDVLGSNVIYFRHHTGRKINLSNFPLTHNEIYSKFEKGEHGIQHPTVIIKTEKMKQYRYGKEFPAEDYELFSRMIRDGLVFANLKEPLYLMRIHDKSSTSTLTFEGIKRTFMHRYHIFGRDTSRLKMRIYYYYIRNYRKYQLADKKINKFYYLLIASICYPQKLLNRLINV